MLLRHKEFSFRQLKGLVNMYQLSTINAELHFLAALPLDGRRGFASPAIFL